MKPIIGKENQDTILTSEITNNHIVVGINNGKPIILTNSGLNQVNYRFALLDSNFTNRNCYGSDGESIKTAIDKIIIYGCKVKLEVFHEKDWKKALQWLIDNAE